MSPRIRLGTVLHRSGSSGNLILGAEGGVKIGETVVDSSGRKVGTVFDFFGPVSGPYVAVKPSIERPERLLGEALFLGKGRR